jgi:mono/diheme cytochrome c family protein
MRKPAAVLLASSIAAVAAFGLVACGGGDSGSGSTSAATTTEQSSGGGAAASEGQTVFVQNCGTCHTLSAAGTDGNIGPNLDELQPDYAQVKTQVINGGGGMPAWKGVLSDAQIDAVSAYVAENAGK